MLDDCSIEPSPYWLPVTVDASDAWQEATDREALWNEGCTAHFRDDEGWPELVALEVEDDKGATFYPRMTAEYVLGRDVIDRLEEMAADLIRRNA